ncbi:sensor histidine kinase [Streptomyces sp. NPDC026672]|uniref:sensor histidine kinase n=1 Tax=unclassified Streptomyces TaxID=2593676 RepID=UPI0033F469FA
MKRHLAEAAVLGATAVVGVVGVISEYRYAVRPMPPLALAVALAVLTVVVAALRRRAPLAVVVAILAVCLVYHVLGYPGLALAAAFYPACYTLVAEGDSRRSLVVGAVASLGVPAISMLPPLPPNGIDFSTNAGIVTCLAAMLALAEARRALRFAADEQLRHVTRESERRLVDERLTIARELHDVLAHTITLITVQAAAGLDALPARPAQAESALRTIRGAAKDAMAELRSTLRVLRDINTADSLNPQPRLAQLAQLMDLARGAGIRVDLVTTGTAPDLPAGVELTAYRVVQEALTNVIRHAHATTATVRITHHADCLHVEVTDNGTAVPGAQPGHGMIGMRERVRAVGGAFDAGPAPGGGFTVSARLDLGGVR